MRITPHSIIGLTSSVAVVGSRKCLLRQLPMVSRDQIKEGYVHTIGKRHNELPEEANQMVAEILF